MLYVGHRIASTVDACAAVDQDRLWQGLDCRPHAFQLVTGELGPLIVARGCVGYSRTTFARHVG